MSSTDIIYPVKVPWDSQSVPHVSIEVNQSCNIECDGCYKNKFAFSKPLELIKREIDLAVSLRQLESVVVVGGEPTLYPHLTDVICYIADKGILPTLLTNGTLLTPKRLREYKDAGLYSVRIHIDKHQRRHSDPRRMATTESELNPLRKYYVDMCRNEGVEPAFIFTLYRDNLDDYLDVVEFCYREEIRDILVPLFAPSVNIETEHLAEEPFHALHAENIYEFMARKQGILPAFYLPSQSNSKKLRWLIYYTVVTVDAHGKRETFSFDPRNQTALTVISRMSRIHHSRHNFSRLPEQSEVTRMLGLYARLSCESVDRGKVHAFLETVRRNGNVRFFRQVFQEFPQLSKDGHYDPCLHCPDATVRNGHLVSLCVVDHVEPLPITEKPVCGDSEQMITKIKGERN
ncbi:MAG: radical SAM protein [Deltaproteobacteria bacterium]|nr:radical SAM protein [Deltaproteobacteria bacterium]